MEANNTIVKSPIKKFFQKTHIMDNPSLIGLALLLIFCSFMSPFFWTYTNWANIMRQSVILGISSLGLTFVILTGHNDLSISGNLAMCTIICAVLVTKLGLPLAMLIAIAAGGAMGYVTGTILSLWNMEPFVATYGMQTLETGFAYLFSGGMIVILSKMPADLYALANSNIAVIPACFLFMIVLYVICNFILKKTRFGRMVYSVGGNSEVCYLSGISVRRMRVAVYTICGIACGLAGAFMLSRTTVGDPSCGGTYTLQCIAACIIGGNKFNGGIGNVWFTMIGVLIVGIIANILNLTGASYYMQLIVQGVIIVAAVAVSSKRRKD